MLVVSYLSQQFLPRVLESVRDIGGDHVQASSWEEVHELIRRKPVSVLVLDPYADRANRTDDIVALLQQFPSTPIIVYAEFTPPTLKVLTVLAQYGLQETLLFQIDDDRVRFGRLLTRLGTLPLVLRLLEELRYQREQLTPQLAGAIDDLFRRPHAYSSGRDLVLASHVPLTSLYRALMEAGFAPPRQLFMAARVTHALAYIRDPGCTVYEVAEKIGYQHPRVLTQHTLAIFGRRPSALRDLCDQDPLPALVRWTTLECPPQNVRSVDVDAEAVWGTLLGYGAYWESVGRARRAARIYQMMLAILGLSEGDLDVVSLAVILSRYGFIARYLGDFDASEKAYQQASVCAKQANIPLGLVRAQVGRANTMMRRGNLGNAEVLLDEVIAYAERLNIPEAECAAYHSRGSVRVLRGRYADSMRDLLNAHHRASDAHEREIIVSDIAACAGSAGYYKLSGELYRILLRTNCLPTTQSCAISALLEFAVYENNPEQFEHWKAMFAECASTYELPVDHLLHAALFTCYGTERFKPRAAAVQAYHEVIVRARQFGSHQIAFKAEERLTALLAGAVPPIQPPVHDTPEALRGLEDALARLGAAIREPVSTVAPQD